MPYCSNKPEPTKGHCSSLLNNFLVFVFASDNNWGLFLFRVLFKVVPIEYSCHVTYMPSSSFLLPLKLIKVLKVSRMWSPTSLTLLIDPVLSLTRQLLYYYFHAWNYQRNLLVNYLSNHMHLPINFIPTITSLNFF